MTEQLKAEAYVRSQRPALMELSLGCEVTYKGSVGVPKINICATVLRTTASGSIEIYTSYTQCKEKDELTIIGHRPQLQDWTGVLHEQTGCTVRYSTYGSDAKKGWGYIQTSCLTAAQVKNHSTRIGFDVDETGQPATEADYKAFNEIVSV